jgi:hypothetical protein
MSKLEDPNNKLEERVIVTGTIQLKYITELEDNIFFMRKYEELTGIDIIAHVTHLLLQDSPKG